ncbi:hypothetical protein niasHT_010926 [Heterodera trifolii]|uniref:Uncharacterized protein n=1 Tax=Heterodera trifolii TaxID=157864 RepID=A0ABD2LFV4_9BILA
MPSPSGLPWLPVENCHCPILDNGAFVHSITQNPLFVLTRASKTYFVASPGEHPVFANVHATDGGGSCATQWWLIVVLQLLVVLLILGLFFAAMWSGYRCRKYVMPGRLK